MSTRNNAEGAMRQAKSKESDSETERFNHYADKNKAEAKIEFYKRIRDFRREKRMRMEMFSG